MNENLKSCNLAEMEALFKEMGQPKFRAKQVYTWLHKGVRRDFAQMKGAFERTRIIVCLPGWRIILFSRFDDEILAVEYSEAIFLSEANL